MTAAGAISALDAVADQPLPPAYAWTAHAPTGLRYHDWFCGAGGSSLGLTAAGMELALAANHWDRAIETHSANFPTAEHLCADLTHYDLRLAPAADVLWASPICTEASPAGGRRRQRAQGELELFGPVARPGMERTRATFWEVIRSTELWRYQAVIVENVVDVAVEWGLFDYWLDGMKLLGYQVQFVSVSSAHIGSDNNPHAPQWRDRLYMVFTRTGVPLPNVEPRPRAWCDTCDQDVDAVQSWKRPGRRIGKYRQQYVYRCPRSECRHAVIEPYVLPAAAAIDWSDLGSRIGDRPRPLAAKTRARIAAGLEMFAQPITAEVAGNTFERRPGVRTWPAFDAPLTTQTTTATKGVACPPFVDVARTNNRPRPVDEPLAPLTTGRNHGVVIPPMTVPAGGTWRDEASAVDQPMWARTTRETDALVCAPFVTELRGGGSDVRHVDDALATVTASGNHHALTVPPGAFYVRHYGGHVDPRSLSRSVREPLGPVTATGGNASLVIPFRRGARPHSPDTTALSTVATREQHGLAQLGIDVDDCLFRMLTPEEHLAAQRFHTSYVVLGNKGERTMQAGNAVSSNVAQWLGAAVAAALCGVTS